jgi:ribonuclease P protein component
MLSKKYRFHSRGGVRATFRTGQTIRTPKISLTHAKNTRGKTRVAIVISKKVLKSAVGRNRIRRRIYEIIRSELSTLTQPTDLIFTIYSRELKNMDHTELKSTISDLLNQII